MAAAYDALSPAMQTFLEGLTACHDSEPPFSALFDLTADDFEDGFQGWSGYGDYTNLRGGSSAFLGGHIAATDRRTGQTWYFRAPISYHGDWSSYFGGSMRPQASDVSA